MLNDVPAQEHNLVICFGPFGRGIMITTLAACPYAPTATPLLENPCISPSRPSPSSHRPYPWGFRMTILDGRKRNRHIVVTVIVTKKMV